MNGQERAEQSFKAFEAWVSSKTEFDFREMATRGGLNRREICRECNIGRSALVQNPRIKEALGSSKSGSALQASYLSGQRPMPYRSLARGQLEAGIDAQRLKRLEAENAGLRAEISELRNRLSSFDAMASLLVETGRFAR